LLRSDGIRPNLPERSLGREIAPRHGRIFAQHVVARGRLDARRVALDQDVLIRDDELAGVNAKQRKRVPSFQTAIAGAKRGSVRWAGGESLVSSARGNASSFAWRSASAIAFSVLLFRWPG
jgi:hypothetical protein